jgi:deazaflavin-dependent oxidoreductase (nitroreductase family)
VDPYIVLGSAVVGFLVGMTGAGGGALLTPMLILLFGVKPSTAISSDLVAAVVMRPLGAGVHLRKGTVNLRLVGWMVLGSVPMAFLGTYLLHLMGNDRAAEANIQHLLGSALLVGAAAMILRTFLDRRAGHLRQGRVHALTVRPGASVVVGMLGGTIVGLTSVGSGSLMIVLLLFLYPTLGAKQLVGTDLTQAVPLTLAAALGSLTFGHVQFGVTSSLIVGSVPAVVVGSFLSSRAPDRILRPIITFVIFASGLKYVGVGATALGWILASIMLAATLGWLVYAQPWRNGTRATGGEEVDGADALGWNGGAGRLSGGGPYTPSPDRPDEQGRVMPDRNDFNREIVEEFRANKGKVRGPFEGTPLLLLHHVGAKSGTERVNPLAYQKVGDSVAVFGSKGGSPTHPDWYHNVVARPDVRVEIGAGEHRAIARVASGEERERIWNEQKQLFPNFAEYEHKAGEREIPVVVLDPA